MTYSIGLVASCLQRDTFSLHFFMLRDCFNVSFYNGFLSTPFFDILSTVSHSAGLVKEMECLYDGRFGDTVSRSQHIMEFLVSIRYLFLFKYTFLHKH